MPFHRSPIRLLALASVLSLASACNKNERPAVSLQVPADLLQREQEPPMTAEALTSERVYEEQRQAKLEWGRRNAGIIDRACLYLKEAGVNLTC